MTARSRILGLMERKAAAQLNADKAELAGYLRSSDDAARMSARLSDMLDDRRIVEGIAKVAADFRMSSRLSADIAAEQTRQVERVASLNHQITARREVLARQDFKRERLADAHRNAKREELEGREASLAALQPTYKPR